MIISNAIIAIKKLWEKKKGERQALTPHTIPNLVHLYLRSKEIESQRKNQEYQRLRRACEQQGQRGDH